MGKTAHVLSGVLITGWLLFPAVSPAADEQSNHTAAFLRMGVDARYLSMGSAGAALADNVAAGYWNPAGLAMIRGWSVTGMTTQKMNFDRRHNYAAGAWGGENLAFGLSWINASTEDLIGADASGPTGETFSFSENALIFSVAGHAGNASVGVSAKLITQDLGTAAPGGGDDNVSGYGFDIGAQFFLTQFARVGIVVQDAFGEVGNTEQGNANDIPANLRAGFLLEPVDGFVLTTDLEKTRDDDNYRFHLGGEFLVPLGNDLAGAARMGVREGDFSGGFGLTFGKFRVDYAYVIEPEAFLDENHRFSFTVDLGTRRRIVREGGGSDRDLDGFSDGLDDCPDDPEDHDGYQDWDGCPDPDNDGDGIDDFNDPCPDEPEDVDGFEDDDGCPDPDDDGDGVLDVDDECPDQPETVNGFEDDDGCPDQVSVSFPRVHLNFASGSVAIPVVEAQEAMAVVEQLLKDHPAIQVEIQGHTDSQGDATANLRLSEQRARAVKEYLVSRGISPDRLKTRGFGETMPIAGNHNAAGRAKNRRIEFIRISD